jgi:hypothetical protein
MEKTWKNKLLGCGLAALAAGPGLQAVTAAPAAATDKKPNILVIWGDDIGMWNVGAYTHGMMGRTPNIDRIAKEVAIFTDHYGQASRSGNEWNDIQVLGTGLKFEF